MFGPKDWKNYILEQNVLGEFSFDSKEQLHPEFWRELKFDNEIRERLLRIAADFFNKLGFDDVEVLDVVLTGSLANFNWSKFSDIDLHLIINYKDIDENSELVRYFLNSKRKQWNETHEIIIKNHEVEVYMQDMNEPPGGIATGVFSLLNN